VRWPAAESHVASVCDPCGSKAEKPPTGQFTFHQTPVCPEVWPVRIVDREGQQSGLLSKACVNRTPWASSSCFTLGIDPSAS